MIAEDHEEDLIKDFQELSMGAVASMYPFSGYQPKVSAGGLTLEELRRDPEDLCNYNACKGLANLSLLGSFFRLLGCTEDRLRQFVSMLPGNVLEFKMSEDWSHLRGYLDVVGNDNAHLVIYGVSHSDQISDLELIELIEKHTIHNHPVRYGKVWLAQFEGEVASTYLMGKVGLGATVINIETLLDTHVESFARNSRF